MSNLFINVECQSLYNGQVEFLCKVLSPDGQQGDTTVSLPQTIIDSNPSVVNNQIIDKVKEFAETEWGVVVAQNEKIMMFGGAM